MVEDWRRYVFARAIARVDFGSQSVEYHVSGAEAYNSPTIDVHGYRLIGNYTDKLLLGSPLPFRELGPHVARPLLYGIVGIWSSG